jgi:hypothetical protein
MGEERVVEGKEAMENFADGHVVKRSGIGVGWTGQSPGWTNGKGEKRSEGRQSRRTNGRRGNLSRTIRKRDRMLQGFSLLAFTRSKVI